MVTDPAQSIRHLCRPGQLGFGAVLSCQQQLAKESTQAFKHQHTPKFSGADTMCGVAKVCGPDHLPWYVAVCMGVVVWVVCGWLHTVCVHLVKACAVNG